MSVAASLSRSTMTVDAGESVSCDVVVHNRGDVVDQLAVELVGDAAGWVTAEPDTVNLMPGTSGTVTLTFAPPRSSEILAGSVPFGVRVRSRENPAASVVEEGEIEVRPFTELTAELLPTRRHARRKARFQVAVENTGNQPVGVTLTAVDVDPVVLEVALEHPRVVAAPGTVTLVRTTVAARKRFLRGQPKQHGFQIALSEAPLSGVDDDWPVTEPIMLAGTLIQERVLPKWVLPALAALAALAAGLVALWFAVLKPAVRTIATEQVAPQVAQASQAAIAAQDAAVEAGAAADAATPGGGGGAAAATPSGGAPPSDAVPPDAAAGAGAGPIEFRIAARANPVTDGSYQRFTYRPPNGTALALGDMLLQNPRGDNGFLRVLIGDSVVLESGLANFRDLDYHYVNPLRVDKGEPVLIEVNCTQPGAGAPTCTPSVSFSGMTIG